MEPNNNKKKLINSKLIISAVVAVLVVMVAFLLFSKQNQNSQNPVPAKTVEPSETVDPNRVEVKNQLISTFPAFPVYPGAKILKSMKLGESPTKGFEAEWQTSEPVPKVMGWYIQNLQSDGWKLVASPGDPKTEGEQGAIFSKDKIKVTINIDRENKNETLINVNIPE